MSLYANGIISVINDIDGISVGNFICRKCFINSSFANPTKWSNTLKQFVVNTTLRNARGGKR